MSSLAIAIVGIHSTLLVTGLSGNIFVLIIHILEWLKTHEPNPCNIIINSIGIFNIVLQEVIAFQEICHQIFPELLNEAWVRFLLIGILTSLVLSSLWCATCLCFFYCVKIVNINSTLMYKLKTKLPLVITWLIVFSVMMSWSYGMLANWDLYRDISFLPVNITENVTIIIIRNGSRCNCFFQISMFLASLAFAIIISTGGAIITSLCKHMSKMKKNSEGSGYFRIQTHLSAAKTVTFLLLFYLVMFITSTILLNPAAVKSPTTLTIGFIVVAFFPTINSIILILGNRKLKNTLKRILGLKPNVTNTEVSVTTHI